MSLSEIASKVIPSIKNKVIITDEFKDYFKKIEDSSDNFFITGKAGSGKSTFLDYFRKNTSKNVVVLAPTGLAAINVSGQTIHSFFKFPPRMVTRNLVNEIGNFDEDLIMDLDTIVIDEVSMVRADLMDGIDFFLRKNRKNNDVPFGGVQIILIGDLFQLPPVVGFQEREVMERFYESPYFFSSQSYRFGDFEILELTQIFRQKDEKFIQILNNIRHNNFSETDMELINSRCVLNDPDSKEKIPVTLSTTNNVAGRVNQVELEKINSKAVIYEADVSGNFPTEEKSLPVEMFLTLKKGARVMFTKNDEIGRWVNGSLGTVSSLKDEKISVRLDSTNKTVDVSKVEWENIKYSFDEKNESVEGEVVGRLMQYPLRLAWAITIHKSQGMTFDKVKIDLTHSSFAHGQTYVALSRCRSLDGITLTRPIRPRDVIVDPRIVDFLDFRI